MLNLLTWKLNIFVRVVKAKMKLENKTAEDILDEYPLLTTDEKNEILQNIMD